MKKITIIFDNTPEVKHLWNPWETKKGKIEGKNLDVEWTDGTLHIEALDPQMVADILFSHDPSSEIVTGKLGIEKVTFTPKQKKTESEDALISALKDLIRNLED